MHRNKGHTCEFTNRDVNVTGIGLRSRQADQAETYRRRESSR